MDTFIVVVLLCAAFGFIARRWTDAEYDKSTKNKRIPKQLPPDLYSNYSWCDCDDAETPNVDKESTSGVSAKSSGRIFEFDPPEKKEEPKEESMYECVVRRPYETWPREAIQSIPFIDDDIDDVPW